MRVFRQVAATGALVVATCAVSGLLWLRPDILLLGLIVLVALLTCGWQFLSRSCAARRPGVTTQLRHLRVQRGLLTRTWFETSSPSSRRWYPVHFHPLLLELPSPAEVTVHGRRLAAITVSGVTLYPSGPARTREPLGTRTDSPAEPDGYAAERARAAARWTRQLRVDAVFLVPAPFVGLLWAYLDGGGPGSWLGATLITGALGLWWAALRGSNPT